MPPIARSVTVRAPAKINLQLGVGPLRSDGYHELVTVFQALSLFDEVTVSDGIPGTGIRIEIDGDDIEGIALGEDNLAYKAADTLAEYADVVADVVISIKKEIPLAGGMAGGSADAAATLVACDALWRTGLGREELDKLAARLGSDVNFALHGGTAVGTGRGEQLTPALISGQFHWVVATFAEGLSTPEMYAALDELREGALIELPEVAEDLMAGLRRGDAKAVGAALSNDLQQAAVAARPELDLVLEMGRDYGALGGIVTGSGPTCVLLAKDAEHALDIAVALSGSGLCGQVKQATGPSHGARIVDAGTTGPVLRSLGD
ncbi:MAG: 4-(cytidine 5'-diphospho)-2-C-methyl-D-erythritol kinase [Candidatus Nanopelagicales bacterium]